MYESPIEYVTSELTKQLEGDVLTLAQSYGVRVDKDELIRALNYDRQQYEKGFADGKAAAANWIPVSERLPEDYVDVLVWFEYFRYGNYNRMYATHGIGNYSKEYNSWAINHETGWKDLHVFAWMPLPEAYKEGGERI